ncbi:UNVERIFIED_CONTAM: hypothetical protein Sradi_5299000 [Sesamum radiatum]|uniref:Uncharacterized protein n=1 Tax=Sesamum radiatum TaxID=300843 RepID=A0AAW2LMK4_SESRA
MVGPLLRSLCSSAARKSRSSSFLSCSDYLKARSAGYTRPFSSITAAATSPSTTDAPEAPWILVGFGMSL